MRVLRGLCAPLTLLTLIALLSACGGQGTGSITGRVTDLARRLCVTGPVPGEGVCFTATEQLRAGLALNDCITLDYRQGEDGRQSSATEVRSSDDCS